MGETNWEKMDISNYSKNIFFYLKKHNMTAGLPKFTSISHPAKSLYQHRDLNKAQKYIGKKPSSEFSNI